MEHTPPSANIPAASSFIEQLKSLRSLLPKLWPAGNLEFKIRLLAALVVTFLGQVIIFGAPLLLERVVNRVAQHDATQGTVAAVLGLVVGYGSLRLLGTAVPQLREFLFSKVGQTAQREVALDVFAHLHQLSLRFHLERRTGGLSRIIERGVRAVAFMFRIILFNVGPTLMGLGIVAVLFATRYSGWFALIAIITVAIYFWFTIASTDWRLKFRREMIDTDNDANTKAIDSLLNYETVKYFNNERYEINRYDASMRAYQNAAIRSNMSLAVVNIGQALIFNAGTVAILWLTVRAISNGTMEVGAITAITLIMMNLYQPLNILGFAYREIKQSLVDMEKMFSLLNKPMEVADRPDALDLTIKGAEISFSDVAFSYDQERQILHGISFDVAPGQTIAIVGASGAGKSTISRILYRFYDITSGEVTIDGQDIRDVTQDSLRRNIGMVPQDTVLFNDTIGYNIAYAKPGASASEIESAAKLAQIHDFITSLPKGYDTSVGERGLKLSGGEKQRVAIARTILKDPPILILDEATSALDSATEQHIQTALKAVSKDRTTLVIAHRLSTIIDADRILVLTDGLVVEQGTHQDLLAQDGVYADLWHRQQEGQQQMLTPT